MELLTPRLTLRPLCRADVPVIDTLIFQDPEVVRGLAHDTSVPSAPARFAADWCVGQGIDGDSPIWDQGGLGGFAIESRDTEVAPVGTVLGAVGLYEAVKSDTGWSGEIFYALAARYHGRGLVGEAAGAVMRAFADLPGPGALYAVYWALLNPASGRILRKIGFSEAGYRSLSEEFGADRALSFRDFELWRLREAGPAHLPRISCEAATKLGHLVHDGLMSADEARADLREAAAGRLPVGYVSAMSRAFEIGVAAPGLAYLEFRTG